MQPFTIQFQTPLPYPTSQAKLIKKHYKLMSIFMSSTPATTNPSMRPPGGNAPAPRQTVRSIPGSYGWPVVGPLSDRLDYFWFSGQEKFFRNRLEKHKSTVFRTNVPPCFPFFTGVNPNVIAVLDCESFSHLFDMEIVEKKNVLVGEFMPSLKYTGDIRVCAYLDTQEEDHAKVKNFAIDILKRSSRVWVTSLLSSLDTMWSSIDESLTKDSSVSSFIPMQKCLFQFLTKSIIGADPASSPEISKSGYIMMDKWLGFQLLPTIYIPVLQPLVEIFLHSFPYPFALVKGDYNKLATFVATEGQEVVQRAQTEFGLTEQQAIHDLLFILGFNAYGGFSIFLPTLVNKLGTSSSDVQEKLHKEVRQASTLDFESVKQMPLVESFVYETLRLNPPVPLQFGRARKDFLLSSSDSVFEVKKGELLCGYQKLVMRDPKVFNDPESFVGDRFVGEMGRGLLDYLYWSNGPQSGTPGPNNKQCAGKDTVFLTGCLVVAYVLQRYDSFTCNSSGAVTSAVKSSN